MAGHNKWSKVKRLKEVTDRRRGAAFTKMLKEIMVAARAGADPDSNARLRKAMSDARSQSVPRDNIERAVKKGSGELNDGVILEELLYEGYGPSGVAFMIECVTDNRNRTHPELKKIFEKHGGTIGEVGTVGWGFEKKGVILVGKSKAEEDRLMNIVLEAGADDLKSSDEGYEILTSPQTFDLVRAALEKNQIVSELAEVSFIPTNKVPIPSSAAEIIEKLANAFEDHDDVQRVTHNAEI